MLAIHRRKIIVVFSLFVLIGLIAIVSMVYALETEKKIVLKKDRFGNEREVKIEYYDEKGKLLRYTREVIKYTYINEEGDYNEMVSTLYDDKGRVIKTISDYFFREGGYDTETVYYTYNDSRLVKKDNFTTIEIPTAEGDVKTGYVISEEYDAAGNIIKKFTSNSTTKKVIVPGVKEPEDKQTTVEVYETAGVITKKINTTKIVGKEDTTAIVSTTYYNKSGNKTHRITYAPYGFKKSKTVERFGTDGKIKNTTSSLITQVGRGIEVPHQINYFEYDEKGKTKKKIYTTWTYYKDIVAIPKKKKVEEYDERGDLKKEKTVHYDDSGNPINITIMEYDDVQKKTFWKYNEEKQKWEYWEWKWNTETRQWEEISYVPEEYFEYEEYGYVVYEKPAEFFEGDWGGEIECTLDNATIEGKWNFTVTGKDAEGSIYVPLIGYANLTGIIENDTLDAEISYTTYEYKKDGIGLVAKEGKITWKGKITKEMIKGEAVIKTLEKVATCKWDGKKKEKIKIHYGSLQRRVDKKGRIHFTYVPACTEDCTMIVFIQVICPKVIFKDGTSSYFEHQSDSSDKWKYQDKDEVNGGKSCVVDYIKGEKDPYLNGPIDKADGGAQGKHGSSRNATSSDRPRIPEHAFTKLKGKHKKDVAKIIYEFEVCALCVRGADAPAYYGCFEWNYEQEKGKGWKKGKTSYKGTTEYTPSKKWAEATLEWLKNH